MLPVRVLLSGCKHMGTSVDIDEGRNRVLRHFMCLIFFHRNIILAEGYMYRSQW